MSRTKSARRYIIKCPWPSRLLDIIQCQESSLLSMYTVSRAFSVRWWCILRSGSSVRVVVLYSVQGLFCLSLYYTVSRPSLRSIILHIVQGLLCLPICSVHWLCKWVSNGQSGLGLKVNGRTLRGGNFIRFVCLPSVKDLLWKEKMRTLEHYILPRRNVHSGKPELRHH